MIVVKQLNLGTNIVWMQACSCQSKHTIMKFLFIYLVIEKVLTVFCGVWWDG